MTTAPDAATILTTFGPLATKVVGPGPDGRLAVLEGYGSAGHFRCATVAVRGLAGLLGLLGRLSGRPRSFLVRGEPLPGADRRRCRRLLHPRREGDGSVGPATFRPAARRWLALDVDGLGPAPASWWLDRPAETVALVAGSLPPEFRGAACVLQATASAAVKPGVRARLWYWLDRPVGDDEAARWLAGMPVDRCLFRAVQPHYTAAPVFRGCPDPLPRRLWGVPGRCRVVPVPELPDPPARAAAAPAHAREGSAYARAALRRGVERVATAPAGGRNEALNAEAFGLARFAASGELGREELFLCLAAAAEAAGLPRAEVVATLTGALRAGEARRG